jgi:hypothetical protein
MVSPLEFVRRKTSIQMNLMNDLTPSVTRWLEMVMIARKGFEVLSKSEGQSDGLVTEEPS